MFKVPNAYEELVKKTTSEMLTVENWELIMEVCDRVGNDNERAHQCFEVINERLLHRNANVVLYTLTLAEALVENCGQNVKQEVASRAFTTTLTRVLNDRSVHDKVKSKVLGQIQKWAFEFRQDPQLSLMEETYTKLRNQRFMFPSPQKPDKVPTKQSDIDKQKEEDDLQLALALSLSSVNDANGKQASGDNKTNYQSPAAIRSEITRQQTVAGNGAVTRRTTRMGASDNATSVAERKKVQVKALFDFNATEEGELGFFKGDVIDVLDQKYRDWWKGELRGKSGIFPANFVQPLGNIRAELSKDIDVETQVFSEANNIEALLRMLGRIDPLKDNVSDNEEIQKLYASTFALRPKIINLIEKYSKKKEELVQLDGQFEKSMRLYDELMQRGGNNNQPGVYAQQQQQQQQQQQNQQQQQYQQNQQHQQQQAYPPLQQAQQQPYPPPQQQQQVYPPAQQQQGPPPPSQQPAYYQQYPPGGQPSSGYQG